MHHRIFDLIDLEKHIVARDGKDFVRMRPLCNTLRIGWGKTYAQLQRDPITGPALIMWEEPRGVVLPRELFYGWLMAREAPAVNPALRIALEDYQEQCAQVLRERVTLPETITRLLGGAAGMSS